MKTRAWGIVSKFEMQGENRFLLHFETPIPKEISNKFSLENLSCIPDVSITNCFVGSNRARGYLISTGGKVLIANNVFETSGSAILIAGDANYWYESGPVRNVTIRDNVFRASCNSSPYQFCNAIISISPEIPTPDATAPYHQNIQISNNQFNPSDYPILYAQSVDHLEFKNNTITRSYAYKPWHENHYNFWLEACDNVRIFKNKIDKNILGRTI